MKLAALLETKLDIRPERKVAPEDVQKAAKLLFKYFKDRDSLPWMYSHTWELEDVRETYSDGLRMEFRYWPKKGKEVGMEPYPDAGYTKPSKLFKTPENAFEYIGSDSMEKFGDKYVFRGMNMVEWVAARKQGYIQSQGKFNFGNQAGYTFYGARWSQGHSYAGGFAPFDKEPTRDLPGVIVAVPKELTQNAKFALGQNTTDEYVAKQIPIEQVKGLWYIVPIQVGKASFELVLKRGELDRGSAAPASSKFVILPKAGIALQESINEGVRLDWINTQLQKLDKEWEDLDSQGTGHARQLEISKEMLKLIREKEKWDRIYAAIGENKQLVMEDTSKQEAALEFLKEKVRNSPFRGQVFLAGGAVRDMILGKHPKDLDVTVIEHGLRGGLDFAVWLAKEMNNFKGPEGPPPTFPKYIGLDDYGAPWFEPGGYAQELMDAIEAYNAYYASYSNPVLFPKFGTAKVNLTGTFNGVSLDGMEVEAVCARREVYEPGNRKPRVFPGTLKDDVFRRDFNANSLMLDLTTGEIHDLTGKGKEDIKNGIIRTTSDPHVIFKEDPLRMLRAVRFMVQKGWQIDPETEEAIKADREWLKRISRERVRDELNKMLVTAAPSIAMRKLRDLGLLPYIAPELQKSVGMTQNIHHVHDVFDHTMAVLEKTNPELIERLMALFHDIGKVVTRSETPTGVHFYGHEDESAKIVDKVMRDLKYPIELIDAVKIGVANHMRLKHGGDDAVKLSDKSLRKFKIDIGDHLEYVLNVIHADNVAHADASAMPNQIANVRKRLESLAVTVKKPTLPITGNDLLKLGVPQGPMIGKILSVITDMWMGNPNITREEALEVAKRIMQ